MNGEHASYNSVAIMKEYDVDLALHTATSIENSEIDKKDLKLRFRGSSNQRIIDVKESLKENKVVEFKLK